jgi:flagellin
MPSITANIPSLNAQANLQRSNASIANSLSRLSSNLRVNTSQQAPVLPPKADNSAATAVQEAVSKTQTEEAKLGNANEILNRMTTLVQTATGNNTSAADRDAINQELSDLKGELKNLSGSTSSDALSKSYDGGNGASYSLVGAAGSRDISISASTTAEDYAGMLTALNGAQQGVSAARESNSAALSAATQNYTNSVLSSANNSGLAVRDVAPLDRSELLAFATSARDMLAAGRLAIANAMGSQSMNLATAILRF